MSAGNDSRPREIENAATGEIVCFVRTGEETGGELLVMEDRWTRSDHEVPAHMHPSMEERWQVIEGSIGYRVDGKERIVGPGESVVAPPGTEHSSWNAGNAPALVRIEMRPALRWEEFIRQLFALAGEGFEDEAGQRSFNELFSEFAPEIQLAAEE